MDGRWIGTLPEGVTVSVLTTDNTPYEEFVPPPLKPVLGDASLMTP